MSLRILLVRHGLSSFNKERRIQGRDDLSTLSEEGIQQARRTGDALAEVPLKAIYSSPLQRARETAALLLEAHGSPQDPLHVEELLEIDLAPWSGLRREDLLVHAPEQERRWREAPETMELEHTDGRR